MKAKAIVLSFALVVALPMAAYAAGPTITLVGGSVSMNPGSSYSEPGYSASDPTDGNITSQVQVSNGVNTNQPGDYSVGYSVTDSLSLSTSASRSVRVNSWGSIQNPCVYNGTCPCPMSADIVSGNHAAWKACVVAQYPKLPNGDTLVCRLKALQPQDNGKIQCDADQAGFGEEEILPNGTEVPIW